MFFGGCGGNDVIMDTRSTTGPVINPFMCGIMSHQDSFPQQQQQQQQQAFVQPSGPPNHGAPIVPPPSMDPNNKSMNRVISESEAKAAVRTMLNQVHRREQQQQKMMLAQKKTIPTKTNTSSNNRSSAVKSPSTPPLPTRSSSSLSNSIIARESPPGNTSEQIEKGRGIDPEEVRPGSTKTSPRNSGNTKPIKDTANPTKKTSPSASALSSSLKNTLLETILPTPNKFCGSRTTVTESPQTYQSSPSKNDKSSSLEKPSPRRNAVDPPPLKNLWDETRTKRYDNFKGRAQHASMPGMKNSPSMQVEASSTTEESYFSFNSATEEDDEKNGNQKNNHDRPESKKQEEIEPPITMTLSYVSQPGFLPPADASHPIKVGSFDSHDHYHDNYRYEFDQTPKDQTHLPPRHSVHRAEFWSPQVGRSSQSKSPPPRNDVYLQRDRIEESRDGKEDDYLDYGAKVEARDPPDMVHLTTNPKHHAPSDFIESTRKSPFETQNSQINQNLGIPSLHSQLSSDSPVALKNVAGRFSSIEKTSNRSPRGPKQQQQQQQQGGRSLPVKSNALRPSAPIDTSTPKKKILVQGKTPSPRGQPSPSTPKLDQRTVRLLYANEFSKMIQVYSAQHVQHILSQNRVEPIKDDTGLSFVIRKRPVSETEAETGEFDVVHTPAAYSDSLVLYEASILADRRTRDLKAHLFRFDNVFSDDDSPEDFYIRTGQPHVLAAMEGGYGSFILVGAKDSGKSQLISDIEERAAFDIFSDSSSDAQSVSIRCMELYGNQCIDLLGPIGTFVRVIETGGTFQLRGGAETYVSSSEDLLTAMSNAKRRYATQGIVRRKVDAESYLIFQISIENSNGTGCLTFVECPSTDLIKYAETEGVSKNPTPFASLMDCIRGKISRNPIDFSSNLTKILHPALTSVDSKVCVVGTISPVSSETEVTLATLLSIKKVMNGFPPGRLDLWNPSKEKDSNIADQDSLPRQWSKANLMEWMIRKKFLDPQVARELSANTNEEKLCGRKVMRMTKAELQKTFYNGVPDADRLAEKLFVQLRGENDRVARLRVKKKIASEKYQTE